MSNTALYSDSKGGSPNIESAVIASEDVEADASAPITFNEQTNYVPRKKIITIFLACSTVDLIAIMDQTTLAASLSIIGEALDASDKTSWISSGYFVTSTCFQLLYGRLSDVWSRKHVLYAGLAIFFLGSLASSLAQTATQLIIFRAFTGIGGGGLVTVVQLIVSDVVPLRTRGKYQGILGAVVALSNGLGPVIGGLLATHASWRWIFRLNLPLTALTVCCVVFFLPLRKVTGDWKSKLRAIDFFGALLALGGTSLVLLGLTWGGGERPWRSAPVVGTIAGGGVGCLAFVGWQWKGTACPLVPMHIFRSGIVNGACITMFLHGWNILVQLYYIPVFYQLAMGYSALRAAAMLLPITIMASVSSTLSGLVVHWLGRYREPILFGWVAWAVGLGLFSTLDASSSGLGKQIGYALLTGVGLGNTLQPALIAIQAGVARRDMAVTTSFRNFTRNLGGTLGLAVAGTILSNLLTQASTSLPLTPSDRATFLRSPTAYLANLPATDAAQLRAAILPIYQQAFRVIFRIGAGMAAVAVVVVWALIPQVALEREVEGSSP
ncbi:putative MFS drug transporter [Aspergillus fijiensis CBS 313.89]|uniref:Cephamycin export protein cmcT n=1 Tax=Aspergillus fijiensis CBS 313.89 TaxID=1448319 RepID=A0A8G1VTX9_9EURO|nr:cephamycin export protein cmcT [Aspergillus fijiensis CBS 313.89]RAK71508.1 cephamycin export protein cmcT [Aspergillus fijiensis CBS 313.89]